MQKFTRTLLAISCLAALSACGGGKSSTHAIQPTPTPKSNEIAQLTQNNTQLIAEKQALEAQKTSLENQKANLEKQLADAKTKAGSGDDVKKLQDKLTETETNLKAANDKLTSANDKIAQAQKILDNENKLLNQLGAEERKVKDLQAKNEKLQEELDKAKTGKTNLADTANAEALKDVQDELAKVKAELKQAQDTLSSTQTELQAAKEALAKNNSHTNTPNHADTHAHTGTDTHTNAQTLVSLTSALDNIKNKFEPARTNYTGVLLSVDNKNKTASSTIYPNNSYNDPSNAFAAFKVGDTKIVLLNNDDTVRTVRKLAASDFPDGNINHDNLGYIGSKYGDISWSGFGQFRFGVYNDSNNQSHLFVYGQPSSAQVVKGNKRELTYKGSAIIGKDGNYRPLEKAVTAVLKPDDNKIDVAIQTEKELLKFSGDIHYTVAQENGKVNEVGARFSGVSDSGRTEGGFFGYDSIGGFFEVSKGAHMGEHGVYGASNDSDVLKQHGYKKEE